MRDSRAISDYQVSKLFEVSLGGISQKILMEGKKVSLPVIITLHGGPGTPIPFSVGARGMFPEFAEHFIMVYWDQLGCGINDYAIKDKFTADSYVDMTLDLINFCREKFPENPLYLFGMSWGSVLAVKSALKAKDKLSGVVTYGQVTRNLFFNEEVYATLEEAGLSKKKMEKISRIDPGNFKPSEMQFFTGQIRKYTNGYINKKGKKAPMGTMIGGMLKSPDYSLQNFKAMMINGTASATKLWPELLQMDLTASLKKVTIPYHILQGDTDIVTSTAFLREMMATSDNRNLTFEEIADSGHIPGAEGMKAVHRALLNMTKQEGEN